MKKRYSISQTRIPGLLFVVVTNTLAAMATQIVFVGGLYGLFKMIVEKTSGLSSEGIHQLATTAILLNCVATIPVLAIAAFSVDIMKPPEDQKLYAKEIFRALYCSIIGVIGIVATRAFEDGRTEPAWTLVALIIPLLFLSRYHEKFRDRSKTSWFPHTVFQYGIQQFVLFPMGLWLILKMLKA